MAVSARQWFQIHFVIAVANVFFAIVAYRAGEQWHGNAHAAFAALFGWLAWRAYRRQLVAGSAP